LTLKTSKSANSTSRTATSFGVRSVLPDGRVQYEWRGGLRSRWKPGVVSKREFAAAVERLVPDDWTPETNA
jgi:hypothetical protein